MPCSGCWWSGGDGSNSFFANFKLIQRSVLLFDRPYRIVFRVNVWRNVQDAVYMACCRCPALYVCVYYVWAFFGEQAIYRFLPKREMSNIVKTWFGVGLFSSWMAPKEATACFCWWSLKGESSCWHLDLICSNGYDSMTINSFTTRSTSADWAAGAGCWLRATLRWLKLWGDDGMGWEVCHYTFYPRWTIPYYLFFT